MSYRRRLVEYALQQQAEALSAQELAEQVVGMAIEAGASMEVVADINAKAVLGELRALTHRGRAVVFCFGMDMRRARQVPKWVASKTAPRIEEPKPPPGIPAVMRSPAAERAMDALLRAFANDAAATLVRVQGEIKQLTDRYSSEYNKIKEGHH